MNKLNGHDLTDDDLAMIAKAHGLVDDKGVVALLAAGHLHDILLTMTMKARFDMFLQGKLDLDTSTPFAPTPKTPVVIVDFGPPTFTVDVDFVDDHDSLKAGRVCDGTHRVVVLADDGDDAILMATQIVGATQGIATCARICI